ncbi:MAG: hypothetical protein K9K78_04210 [Spirochaetales bacterium]|nr:hypothetical protein [Spirochaetales bacterium]
MKKGLIQIGIILLLVFLLSSCAGTTSLQPLHEELEETKKRVESENEAFSTELNQLRVKIAEIQNTQQALASQEALDSEIIKLTEENEKTAEGIRESVSEVKNMLSDFTSKAEAKVLQRQLDNLSNSLTAMYSSLQELAEYAGYSSAEDVVEIGKDIINVNNNIDKLNNKLENLRSAMAMFVNGSD